MSDDRRPRSRTVEGLLIHDRNCGFFRAATSALGVECPHGREVCPLCDPCLCTPKEKKWG